MIISGHQPNYLPWLGYFHKMKSCDLFVILDDVVHSRRAITSRNKIKGPEGARLLSVPMTRKDVTIKDVVMFNESRWYKKHWGSLQGCYTRATYWKDYRDCFYHMYNAPGEKLADFNLRLIELIREIFDIKTPVVRSSETPGITGKKGTKIINICKYFGADTYLSGNGARVYNDASEFARNNLRLVYQDFEHPVYPQLWGSFVPNLSAVDLIFNCGPESKIYLPKQVVYE
ncbi:MAG: hypothetical protein VR69_06160 [Peptococcaceae bacterium BRH_c4b]|nr:MAG: hypothetical protein VR69_06160 [Peptococcaceae bacterium BRH_c4b]